MLTIVMWARHNFSPSFHSYTNPQTAITMSQIFTKQSKVSFNDKIIQHEAPKDWQLQSLAQGTQIAQSEGAG